MPALQSLEAGQGVRGVKVDKVRGVGRQDGPGVTFVSMLYPGAHDTCSV